MLRTDRWGIDNGYESAIGKWHETPAATHAAILAAMGLDSEKEGPPGPSAVRVLRQGQEASLRGPGELLLEDGARLRVEKRLPEDLPAGYHRFDPVDGTPPVQLIVSPQKCFLPPRLRTWGWAVQLYALRSRASWGIGDLADLHRFAAWSRKKMKAGVLLVNPLHAATPLTPIQPSPYFPSTRIYRDPLYLRIEEAPGAAEAGLDLEKLAAAGRSLNKDRRIDRDAVVRLKFEALQVLWRRFGGDPAFDRYLDEQGEILRRFAAFCALARHHGQGWQMWPAEYRRPDASGVAAYMRENTDRIRFHQWIQWILDRQLKQAANELRLVQDLPVGVDPQGADAWIWQDAVALDATIGAPPDEFNTRGQDWALAPFIPHRLGETACKPFRRMIQAALRHAGGLRIDHVMGLFRLYWVPRGSDPSRGAYVRYPAEHLLAILAIESQRAKAFVVGEDLGTVEKDAQQELARRRVLSYRVLWFERGRPETYPRHSLAAVTTHDLPTIAGLWSGSDLQKQKELDLKPNEKGMNEIRRRLARMIGLPDKAAIEKVIIKTHALLSGARSAVVAATLEDGLGLAERPNMPGAPEHPNWSIALPVPLEEIERHPLVLAVGEAVRRRKRLK